MIPRDGGDRDRNGSGVRRPQLLPSDQHMLTKIRDSLKHLHPQDAGQVGDPNIQSRIELSQSTPNLVEKPASGIQGKVERGFGYNVKALEKIRKALRPFQNDSGNTSNSSTQGSDDAGDTSSVNKQFLQQIVMRGIDAELASRALKLSGNKSPEAALEYLSKLHIGEGKNGISNYGKVKRKPSFEMKYLQSQSNPSSDTTSIRSESPNLSLQFPMDQSQNRIVTSQATNIMPVPRQITTNPITNGDGTPPPVPPRAPIIQPLIKNQTPQSNGQIPDSENGVMNQNITVSGSGPSFVDGQQHVTPGQVQEIIKHVTPAVRETVRSSIVPRDPPRTHIVHSTKVQQQTPPQRQQAESISSSPQRGMSPITVNRHSSSANTSSTDSVQISIPGRTAPSPLPVPMHAWGATNQQPLIMQPVNSKKVTKPVLQQATVPMSPASPSSRETTYPLQTPSSISWASFDDTDQLAPEPTCPNCATYSAISRFTHASWADSNAASYTTACSATEQAPPASTSPDHGTTSTPTPQNTAPLPPTYLPNPNELADEETDTETLSTVSDTSQEKTRCTSPMPERKPEAKEKDALRRDACVRHFSPQAFKFYMEQHVENVLKSHQERQRRRLQLESEMAKANLCEDAQKQMRKMLCQKESNYIRQKEQKWNGTCSKKSRH
ncbi:hypothetical protein ScPMuIL_012057 [Solemya velum]